MPYSKQKLKHILLDLLIETDDNSIMAVDLKKNNNIISLLHNQLRYSIKKTAYFALILSLLNLKCLEKYIHVNFCKERFDMICLTLSQIRSNKFWTRKKKDKKKKYQSISSVCIEILWLVIIQTLCEVVVVYIDFLLDNWKIISIWQ